jgi:hypothetical protein
LLFDQNALQKTISSTLYKLGIITETWGVEGGEQCLIGALSNVDLGKLVEHGLICANLITCENDEKQLLNLSKYSNTTRDCAVWISDQI